MKFLNADIFIHLLWTVPAILILLYYAASRRNTIINNLLGSHMGGKLTVSLNRSARNRKILYFIICWMMLITALARPWWGEKLVEEKVSSRDILVCLDTSRSMLAKDISPTRLQHAKWWLTELVNKCPGDRFGLINFAGEAVIECPLTSSSSSFLDYLENTDTDNIPIGGTNIGSALNTALQAFKGAEGAHRAVILVSDGDELQGDSSELLDEFKQEGIPVITVGIGDPNQPGVIELPDGKILRNKKGDPVISKLNEQGLVRIATKTDGLYARTTVVKPMIKPVYSRIMKLTPESKEGTRKNRRIERYRYPLFIALFFLMTRLYAGERRKKLAMTAMLLTVSLTGFSQDDIPPQLIPVPEETPIAEKKFLPPQQPQQVQQAQKQQMPKQPSERELRLIKEKQERTNQILELEKKLEELQQAKAPQQDSLDKAYYNIGTLYQKNGDLKKSAEYYEKMSSNPHKDLLKRAMNNLSAVELQKAVNQLSSDPTKALESLDQAQYYLKRAMSAADGDTEIIDNIKNNLQALFKYRKTAKAMKELQEMVEKAFKDTVDNTQEALKLQAQADQGKKLTEQVAPVKEIPKKINVAEASLKKLTNFMQMGKMPEEQLKKYQSAGDDLKRAKENASKQLLPLSDQKRKEVSDTTKQALVSALTKLGVPPQQQQQQQDQKDQQQKEGEQQKQDQQQQKEGEQQGQQQKDGQDFDKAAKELEEKDKKQAGEKKIMKRQKIDKKQAETILRTMKAKEQDLKEELKKLQKRKQHSRGQYEKNW